jgi:SNF2 family DNA or RNA helicase
MKNFEAKRTQRMLTLGAMVEYKLILNGTPITKNVMDIWSQIHFLSP